MKKIKKRVPSTRITFHFRREKTRFVTCTNCGNILHGVPRVTAVEPKSFSASEKNPNRSFAGQFCGNCVREIFRDRARMI